MRRAPLGLLALVLAVALAATPGLAADPERRADGDHATDVSAPRRKSNTSLLRTSGSRH